MSEITGADSYTEARHTAYAQVTGTEPVPSSTPTARMIRPESITANWHWRTQLDHTGWHLESINLSGRWLKVNGELGEGSSTMICGPDDAPDWAREFAETHRPTLNLKD